MFGYPRRLGCCCGPTTPPTPTAVYGYLFSGSNSTVPGAIRFDFVTETWSGSSAEFSTRRASINSAAGNPSQALYFAGGFGGPTGGGGGSTATDTTDKLDLATETISTPGSALLSVKRYSMCGLSDRSSGGYYLGGTKHDGISLVDVVTADKLTFSSDSMSAQASADLTVATQEAASCNAESAGYSSGGTDTSGRTDTIHKTTFSTDATATIAATLSSARHDATGSSNGTSAGYIAGGQASTFPTSKVVDKLDFATDAISTPGTAALANGRRAAQAFGTGSLSYIIGGEEQSSFGGSVTNVTTTEKIDYSTDTSSALPATGDRGGVRGGHGSDVGI